MSLFLAEASPANSVDTTPIVAVTDDVEPVTVSPFVNDPTIFETLKIKLSPDVDNSKTSAVA